jgi:GT2 family glycosyltransferase
MEESRPFISVIVPTYERAGQLSVCLGALAAQDYPGDRFEVLVVDDGSLTSLDDSVETFRHQLNVRLLKQSHSGPAAARNYGASHAQGSFLAFTDDDCSPATGWLRTLATTFISCSDCTLGGRTINELPNNPYSTASQLITDYLYANWNEDPTRATFFATYNLAIPKNCFHAVGEFDAGWTRPAGEDRDLCDRLITRGYRLMYVPDALVRHAHSLTLRTFWLQHFNYGGSSYHLHRMRAQHRTRAIRAEPLGFYLRMVGYPFARASGRNAVLLAVLVSVAQIAHAAGFLWERAMRGRTRRRAG